MLEKLKKSAHYLKRKIKGLSEDIETTSVDKLDWIRVEHHLANLVIRLDDCIDEVDDIIAKEKEMIEQHKKILEKAYQRRSELLAKRQKTKNILSHVSEAHK